MNLRPPASSRQITAKPDDHPTAVAEVELPSDDREHGVIRGLIWVYFWLLLIEGALRKWVFPGLTNELLLIRDPVVILIYVLALSGKVFPWNGFITASLALAAACGATSFFAERTNFLVTLFGLRTNFMHLPLIFLLPKVLNRQDVEKIAKWLFISSVPMAILAALQFRAGPGAWINVGVGASEGSQLTAGFGKIRPAGTFSFTTGFALYLTVLVSYVISWQLRAGSIKPWLALTALFATGMMVAVSGSRSVLSSFTLILAGAVFICVRKPIFLSKGMRAILLMGTAFMLLQFRSEVRVGMIVHDGRLEGGGGIRTGLVDRALDGLLEPFVSLGDLPLFGNGIGVGTGVGSGLLTAGDRGFLLGEGEWTRILGESGPILGSVFIALRIAMVISLGFRAYRALDEENPLPLLLFAGIFPVLLNGQFGVPTVLGFATFGAGLCSASANIPLSNHSALFRIRPQVVTNPDRKVRGRSIYAEKLHG